MTYEIMPIVRMPMCSGQYVSNSGHEYINPMLDRN